MSSSTHCTHNTKCSGYISDREGDASLESIPDSNQEVNEERNEEIEITARNYISSPYGFMISHKNSLISPGSK